MNSQNPKEMNAVVQDVQSDTTPMGTECAGIRASTLFDHNYSNTHKNNS